MSGMPQDVRARIQALFPTKPTMTAPATPASLPARDRTKALLVQIEQRDPRLGEYARRLVAVPAPPSSAATARQELALTAAALRILNARRELAQIAVRLADAPDDAAARSRAADLSAYINATERNFPTAAQRARAELQREARSRSTT
jgi:hypothetical protein